MARNDTGGSAPAGEHRSIWLATTEGTDYDHLDDGLTVDTAVVGGGILGITTALKLTEFGQSVAVVERDRILEGVTGHTTAKLTSLHGLIYDHLLDHFGHRRAHQYARANQAAIDDVEDTARQYDLDCDFERAPAITYTTDPDREGDVRDEVTAASKLGLPARFVEETELPYDVAAAVRFDDQAHFHPRKYLLGLAREVAGDGSYVFEDTRATDISDGKPCTVETDRGTITADDVVVATHFPIVDPALYFARLSPKRSYVIAAELAGDVPTGMYYDPDEPYFSVRPSPAGDDSMALIGGQNHRTGHGGSTEQRYRALERQARSRFDVESIEYRWATQDYVSVDKVPFVGPLSPGADHVYVGTGFGGWGMTNGVAAARLLADLVLDRGSPWREVFHPNRIEVTAGAGKFLEHNAHAMRHVVADTVGSPPAVDLRAIGPGTGQVIEVDGDEVAVSRDEDGEVHAVSARCTHMDCVVEWNDGESSWDCPCHGSRFAADGSVIETPAVDDLEPVDLRAIDVDDRTTTSDAGADAPEMGGGLHESADPDHEEIER